MFKNFLLIIFLSFVFFGCSVPQQKAENSLDSDIEREKVSKELIDQVAYIIFLLRQNNIQELNANFINPKIGYYEIYKSDIGNKNSVKHLFNLEEIQNNVDSFEIKEEEVIFNCSPYNDAYYGWNKDGVFLSSKITPYLSQILNLKIEMKKYPKEELDAIAFIEKTSYEVVVTNNIIFYLTKIGNRWYITLVDKIKTDCSR